MKENGKKTEKRGKGVEYKVYPISVTVFEGENGISVKVQKTYKDDKGNYQTTDSFKLSELSVIAELIKTVVSSETEKREFEF